MNLTMENPYTKMQQSQYERDADLMNQENHMFHNANQDYWDILVSDTEIGYREKIGLDFGCGCGRNIQNLWYRFKRMDGVDISQGNLKHAINNLSKAGCPAQRSNLYLCNGVDLKGLGSNRYDFIMSTIVMQHIAVHDIRYNYLKEFYRILREDGLLSFQMGFGEGYGKAGYYENHYHATETNTLHDTIISDPNQIINELREIGFSSIRYFIRPSFSDGHPYWIFIKAQKIENKPRLLVFSDPINFEHLQNEKVSYQAAQFSHMKNFSDTIITADISKIGDSQAIIIFDEHTLLTDDRLKRLVLNENQLLVYISHDYWCHPLKVAEFLNKYKNVLMVLRHLSAKIIFDHLLPKIPKIIQRPGVETSIFHPLDSPKKFDIVLGGSETPDYPLRQKLNKIVREYKNKYNWNVIDLTGKGLMSNPKGTQSDYASILASSKISPTSTNRGGAAGARLAIQYFDLSVARMQFDHDFYGLKYPEISIMEFETAGITPRYLESLASKCLLVGDLPKSDSQKWYENKMIIIDETMPDGLIAETLDYWIKHDKEREKMVNDAYNEVILSETSYHKAEELVEAISNYLKRMKK